LLHGGPVQYRREFAQKSGQPEINTTLDDLTTARGESNNTIREMWEIQVD